MIIDLLLIMKTPESQTGNEVDIATALEIFKADVDSAGLFTEGLIMNADETLEEGYSRGHILQALPEGGRTVTNLILLAAKIESTYPQYSVSIEERPDMKSVIFSVTKK